MKLLIVPLMMFSLTTLAAPLKISQNQAVKMLFNQGPKAKELELQYKQYDLALATALSNFDWKLTLNTGYTNNKTETFSPSMLTGSTYEQYQTDIYLQKSLASTGSILGVEAHELSQNANINYTSSSTTYIPPHATQNIYAITLEQPLLNNFFGEADRATYTAAQATYKASEILYANDKQSLALDTIHQFWDTYVAQENYKEALASKQRYQKILDSVKKKTNLGYSAPGDLAQSLAQYEVREQAVQTAYLDYVQRLDAFKTTLNIPSSTEIEFVANDKLPSLPAFDKYNIENLRAVQSQKLKVKAAQDLLDASLSKKAPTVNFVAKGYGSATSDSVPAASTASLSGNHPEYYVGLKVSYNFGSDLQNEDIKSKRATKDLEDSKLARQQSELKNTLDQAERKVKATFDVAQSTLKQKQYYDNAVQELNKSYSQGRTDIKTLIDVLNSFFAAEVQYMRAVGNYQTALSELAAAKDEQLF